MTRSRDGRDGTFPVVSQSFPHTDCRRGTYLRELGRPPDGRWRLGSDDLGVSVRGEEVGRRRREQIHRLDTGRSCRSLDDERAEQAGGFVQFVFAVSFAFFRWTQIEYTLAELVVVGVGWTVLTVGFEFLVGYVEGTPVSVTIGQYDVLAGQVWIAVPLTLLLSPVLFGR